MTNTLFEQMKFRKTIKAIIFVICLFCAEMVCVVFIYFIQEYMINSGQKTLALFCAVFMQSITFISALSLATLFKRKLEDEWLSQGPTYAKMQAEAWTKIMEIGSQEIKGKK